MASRPDIPMGARILEALRGQWAYLEQEEPVGRLPAVVAVEDEPQQVSGLCPVRHQQALVVGLKRQTD